MSAVHHHWKQQQADRAAARSCAALGVCQARAPRCADCDDAEPEGGGFWLPSMTPAAAPLSDTTRHYARTQDEAFKTPAWRNPVQGPYRRAPSGWRPMGWLAVVLLLAVAAGLTLPVLVEVLA